MVGTTDFPDVYKRVQVGLLGVGNLDQTSVVTWLTGGDIVTEKTLNVRMLAEDIEAKAIKELSPEIDNATTAEDFEILKDIQIDSLKDDIEQRKAEVVESYAQVIREASNLNDFEYAVEELRVLNPNKLKSMKGWETRRGKIGLRVMFS